LTASILFSSCPDLRPPGEGPQRSPHVVVALLEEVETHDRELCHEVGGRSGRGVEGFVLDMVGDRDVRVVVELETAFHGS
jgi:hypothetical protein